MLRIFGERSIYSAIKSTFSRKRRLIITDFTCEIHDEDGELNTVKFTYQYQDRRTYLPTDHLSVDHDRIFTAPFNPTYN